MITRRNFNRMVGSSFVSSLLLPAVSLPQGDTTGIKVGQIGTGHSHADGKMETLRRLSDIFEVVGIAEPNESLWELKKDDHIYQGLRLLSVEELLKVKGLQVILVETDLPDLLSNAEFCLNAGLPIHLDKPAGKDIKHFNKILSLAQSKNLIVQMGYMFRYNPAFQFCLEAVRKGWLGDIFEIDGVISKSISAQKRVPLVDIYQGSMMLLGCHLIDMVIAILGEPQKVSGFRRRTLEHQDDLSDNELAVLEYPNATATIRSALVEVEGWERRQFVVCGTKGTIEIKPLEPPFVRLALEKPVDKFVEGYQVVEMPPEKERYDDQLLQFARMVKGQVEPDYSYQHDLAVQKAVLEAAGLMG